LTYVGGSFRVRYALAHGVAEVAAQTALATFVALGVLLSAR
jgi:hypothetical protein